MMEAICKHFARIGLLDDEDLFEQNVNKFFYLVNFINFSPVELKHLSYWFAFYVKPSEF